MQRASSGGEAACAVREKSSEGRGVECNCKNLICNRVQCTHGEMGGRMDGEGSDTAGQDRTVHHRAG